MKYFYNHTMRTKLVFAFIFVTVFSVIMVAFLVNYMVSTSLTDAANRTLFASASQSANTLDNFINTNLDSMRIETKLPGLVEYLRSTPEQRQDSPEEILVRNTLQELSKKNKSGIISYALLDNEGQNLIDTVSKNIGQNEFKSHCFKDAILNADFYASNVIFSDDNKAYFYFCGPVLSTTGEMIGVLRVQYDISALQKLVEASNGLAGSQSFAILIDENHIRLAHGTMPTLNFKSIVPLDEDKLAKLQNDRRLPRGSSAELSTNLPDFERGLNEFDINDPYFMTTLATIINDTNAIAVTKLSSRPWLLVFAQPQSVFLAPIAEQSRNIALLTGGILMIVVIVAVSMARWLTTPIINLTSVTKQVAGGNLSIQVPVESADEIGELAEAFNIMTNQLRDMINTLEERVASRTRRLEIVASLSGQLNTILNVDELVTTLVNQVKETFGYYHVHIYILDKERKNLVMRAGYGLAGATMKQRGHAIPLDTSTSLVARVVRTQDVIMVNNTHESSDWLANPLLPDTRSEMAVPIIVNEQVIGVLDVQQDKIGGLDDSDANLLRSLANHVAIAITNARLFAQNQATLRETETLFTISQRMLMASNLTELIIAIVGEAPLEAINRVVLFTFDYNDAGEMYAISCQANWYSGQGVQPTVAGTRYLRAEVPILNLFVTENPLFFTDAQEDERIDAVTLAIVKRQNVRNMAVLPLWSQGRQLGVLLLEGEEPHLFNEQEIRPYQTMLGQLSVAVENQQLLLKTIQSKEEADHARARADMANQAKSDFLSRMSHELRTPLNGILGYAQILKNDTDISRKQMDGLNVIQQSGEHLLTLITDILDLAKIEAGKFELLPSPIQLDNFMRTTLAIIQMRADKKRLEVIYQSLNIIPEAVAVDEKRLRQVLLNLLNNAIKFTEVGQIKLQLEVVDQPDINHVRLRFSVIDTGIGMTPEQLQHIFNPFEQVGDVKKRAEGTGLGLAISQQLVESMGGQLHVESEFNHGSTFWFELPLPLANLTLTQTPVHHERIVGYEGPPRKVLVVDDKVNNRMVFLNILEPLGFEVALAEDGQEAIDQAKSWKPDLILMDMIMPNMTGFEATQIIRNIPALKTITIIGTSASAFEKEAERVKLIGCDAFISKPVHVEELILLIGELLHLEWRYQQPIVETVSSVVSNPTELVCPPIALLNEWQELAMMGDLLTLEEAAQQLVQSEEKYKPFVEQLLALTTKLNMNKVMNFLEPYLL